MPFKTLDRAVYEGRIYSTNIRNASNTYECGQASYANVLEI